MFKQCDRDKNVSQDRSEQWIDLNDVVRGTSPRPDSKHGDEDEFVVLRFEHNRKISKSSKVTARG